MWAILEKSELRDAYVRGEINKELHIVYEEIDSTFEKYAEQYIIVIS